MDSSIPGPLIQSCEDGSREGTVDAKTAEKQFEENVRLFGSPAQSHAEQYNLYAGLANRAKELQALRK